MTAQLLPARRPIPDKLLRDLRALFGDRFSTAASVLSQHAADESHHAPAAPDGVVFARSTEEVAAAVGLCAITNVPVIAFGAGTALEGHVNAVCGGISIDLSRMDAVIRISAEDLDCSVQAGVRRKQLNSVLRDSGLFFPIDPGPDATLGGMAATRASGTNAVRYGTMRDNVMGLTVVLADGSVVHTGSRARKSSAGYDLTGLFVGSEGTLGIITELTLRLHGIPESVSVATCTFATIKAAVDTAIAVIQSGVPIARVELLDDAMIRAINRYSGTHFAVAQTLFFEFHGSESGVREQTEIAQMLAHENGGQGFRFATQPEERTALWQARHDAYYAAVSARVGARGWATDVCVPLSNLAECIVETKDDIVECPVPACIVGHVGDGNFHVVFSVDPSSPTDQVAVDAVSHRLVERALRLHGTCTGEHGVGLGKKAYMTAEHGDEGIALMRRLKLALDPQNIMNPDKIFNLQ